MAELTAAEAAVRARLFALQDVGYRAFHSALMPTVAPARVIGVRMPALRALAKELRGTAVAAEFVRTLGHTYYEEQNLHALLIEQGGFEEVCAALERFLPTVDNWASCDLLRPKVFAAHKAELLPRVEAWLRSEATYVRRFGIRMHMVFYLDEAFCAEYPRRIAQCANGDYYVDMAVAWYFAEALAKQPAAVLPLMEAGILPRWTHNKAIQKAVESLRIPAEMKGELRTLRRKKEGGMSVW